MGLTGSTVHAITTIVVNSVVNLLLTDERLTIEQERPEGGHYSLALNMRLFFFIESGTVRL